MAKATNSLAPDPSVAMEDKGGVPISCSHDGPLEEEHLGFYYVVTIRCTLCGLIDYRFYKEAP